MRRSRRKFQNIKKGQPGWETNKTNTSARNRSKKRSGTNPWNNKKSNIPSGARKTNRKRNGPKPSNLNSLSGARRLAGASALCLARVTLKT